MAYVPNNAQIFAMAFAGSMAGFANSAPGGSTNQANFAQQAAASQAWAQAVDTAWGANPNNAMDAIAIGVGSGTLMKDRAPAGPIPAVFLNQSNWTITAQSIVASVLEGDVVATANGITFPNLGSGGGGATLGNIISVTTTALLTAASTAGLTKGARATITQRFSIYSYQPADTSAADGWHVPAAGGGNWVYSGPTDGATMANQTTWFVDPQNVSTTASDDNDGLTSATAVLHKAEILRRWGATNPESNAARITINFLSADTGNTDPGVFNPIWTNAAATGMLFTIPALPASSFTGTLNAVTNKVNNAAPGNALSSTFTTATGAMAVGLKLVNATRGNSVAFATQSLGGGAFEISQPMTPYSGTGGYVSTEVNTWATGDSITGYALPSVNIVDGTTTGTNAAQSIAWNISIPEFSGFGADQLLGVTVIESNCARSIVGKKFVTSLGSAFLTGLVLSAGLGAQISMFAGFWNNGGPGQIDGGGRVTFLDDAIVVAANCVNTPVGFTSLCLDGTLVYQSGGGFADLGLIYGPGTLNNLGFVRYASPATGKFFCTLQLQGQTTGYSIAAGAIHSGITLNAANFDAAAGAAGFGNQAFNLTGASYTTGAQN